MLNLTTVYDEDALHQLLNDIEKKVREVWSVKDGTANAEVEWSVKEK